MKLFGLITCALLAAAPVLAAKPASESLPNIIVILGDNIGYGEVSCYDNSRMVETPRLDKLAAQGLRLTNFNVETWCAPSRSADPFSIRAFDRYDRILLSLLSGARISKEV